MAAVFTVCASKQPLLIRQPQFCFICLFYLFMPAKTLTSDTFEETDFM